VEYEDQRSTRLDEGCLPIKQREEKERKERERKEERQ